MSTSARDVRAPRRVAIAVAATVSAVLIALALVRVSAAGFSATTANPSDGWDSGTVTLTDDDAGTALFNSGTQGLLDGGQVLTRCITVTYTGTVTAGVAVRAHAAATGDLAPYLNVTLDEGTGPADAACTGFTPAKALYTGTLTSFATDHPTSGTGVGDWRAAPGQSRTYRFTLTVQNAPAAQNKAATGTFTWDVSTGNSPAALADYALNWSPTSVGGAEMTYPVPMALTGDVPAGQGATMSLRMPPTPNGGSTQFSSAVTLDRPGTVSFWHKTSTEGCCDPFIFLVDGVEKGRWSGESAWAQDSFALPAGPHTLTWRFQKDGSMTGAQDTAWVALLQVTNVTNTPATFDRDVHTFDDGALPPALTTSTWTVSTDAPLSGARSLRSPVAPANSAAHSATFTIPARPHHAAFSFDYRVNAEQYDPLQWSVNGTLRGEARSNPNGTDATGVGAVLIPASASPTAVTISFVKDNSFGAGADAAWIDNLSIPR